MILFFAEGENNKGKFRDSVLLSIGRSAEHLYITEKSRSVVVFSKDLLTENIYDIVIRLFHLPPVYLLSGVVRRSGCRWSPETNKVT